MEHLIPKPALTGEIRALQQSTSARIGVWRAGTRPLTATFLQFRLDHAKARDAVHSRLSPEIISWAQTQGFPVISTLAENRLDFVLYPPKGKRALPETIANLEQACPKGKDVQIVISDGLSANAVDANIYDLLPMLQLGLQQEGISSGLPVVVQLGRVAIADQIAHALKAKVAVNLIGERPGLSCASGMSAYITYNPGPQTISSDRTVVSNIHAQGTPPVEAGAYIVSLIKKILTLKVSGVKLQQLG